MNEMELNQKFDDVLSGIYKICKSLIYIVDTECCSYGQDESIEMAEAFIAGYEADHPEVKEGD